MKKRTFKNGAFGYLAEVGKALGSPARLEILELLSQAPRTVEVLADEIAQSTANTSHHLQKLKAACLVRSERDGLHSVYSLAGDDVSDLLVQLHTVAMSHLAGLQKVTTEFFSDRDGVEAISLSELRDRMETGDAYVIDVRPSREFAKGHIPGARSVPLEELDHHLTELPHDTPIIAYCRGPFCTFSADAVRRLRELGFDARRTEASIHSFRGAWQ